MHVRPVFGRKKPAFEEPARPATPPQGQIFDNALFEGEIGDFLRQHGYAPDDPRNQAVNVQPLSVLLAEDLAGLRRATHAVNQVADYPLAPWHLLPPTLWRTGFGPWLRQELDLSPCRPWNTIFLPADARGAAALGLPVLPSTERELSDETITLLAMFQHAYGGKRYPESEAAELLMASIRANNPYFFPADRGDFSERVRKARADVRALAVTHAATGPVNSATILKSHQTFLGRPEEQLTA